ncbi:MAG: restriction endonuclease subunit S [Lachnospira sp.]
MMYVEDCCEILDSMRVPITASEREEGEYPYYGANGIQDHVADYIFDDELVLLAEDGGNFGSKERPIAYRVSGKCWVNNHAHVLKPKDGLDVDYLCYSLMFYKVDGIVNGATRQKLTQAAMRKLQIPSRSMDEQKQIVDELNRIIKIKEQRQQELALLDDLIKARFVELFGDPRSNPFGFEKKMLKDTCKVITGNTPSRAIAEYYGDYIEWIKTDNIVSGILNPTQATESLSEKGMNVGRTVEKDSILMACIAGSIASIGRVCITDRTVAFNQQINAVVPEQYNILFLYVLLQMSKDYLVEDINMALKGILSKSKLEEKEFIIPPMDLQEQFSDFVHQVDKSKVAVQKALDETQLLFDSLMQEYFG